MTQRDPTSKQSSRCAHCGRHRCAGHPVAAGDADRVLGRPRREGTRARAHLPCQSKIGPCSPDLE